MGFRDNSIIFFEIDHFDLENESGIGRDYIAGALRSISVMGWACQYSLLPLLKLLNTLVPSSDHLASSHLKLKWIAASDARVKNGAIE